MSELPALRAVDQAAMLRRREVSAVELLDAHLERVDATNPDLNAIVILTPDLAREMAEAADRRLAEGGVPPLLIGLPAAHKDVHEVAGVRTTFGSPVYALSLIHI